MRKAIGDLRSLVKRTMSRVEKLSLNDEQNSELCTLVQSIQESCEGQDELQKNYSEAEKTKEGRGAIIKSLWENDVSELSQFMQDQKFNGKILFCVYICTCIGVHADVCIL